MKIEDIIQMIQNRLASLQAARESMWQAGDVVAVISTDQAIAETQETLDKLLTLE